MMMTTISSCLASRLARTAFALGTLLVVGAAACAQSPEVASIADLRAPFGASERSAEAIAEATRTLEKARSAYRTARRVEDRVTVRVLVPGSPANEDRYRLVMGPGTDARIDLDGATVLSLDGHAMLVPVDPSDKYLRLPLAGTLHETLRKALPGFSLPAPQFALRERETLSASDFSLEAIRDARIVGARTSDSGAEVLLEGANDGAIVLGFDPAQGLLRTARAAFAPDGAPQGYVIGFDIRFDPTLVVDTAMELASVGGGVSLEGRTAVATIAEFAAPPVRVGDPSPSWTATTAEGSTVSLVDLRGSVVVIDLWATWCGPCKRVMPSIDQFARWAQSEGKPIRVFAINTLEQGDREKRVATAMEWWSTQSFAVPLIFDLDDSVFRSYRLGGLPATIVIGPDGVIAAIHMGINSQNPSAIIETLRSETPGLVGQPTP